MQQQMSPFWCLHLTHILPFPYHFCYYRMYRTFWSLWMGTHFIPNVHIGSESYHFSLKHSFHEHHFRASPSTYVKVNDHPLSGGNRVQNLQCVRIHQPGLHTMAMAVPCTMQAQHSFFTAVCGERCISTLQSLSLLMRMFQLFFSEQ